MTDLRSCPFCKQNDWRVSEQHNGVVSCGNCTAEAPTDYWQQRPLEDSLQQRNAELEAFINEVELRSTDNVLAREASRLLNKEGSG